MPTRRRKRPAKSRERIIQERLRDVIRLSEKKHIIDYSTMLVIRKGSQVPEEFRGLPQLKKFIDRSGIALNDWEDAWCQSAWEKAGDWDNSWGECWDNTGPSSLSAGLYETRINIERVKLEDFSTAARALLTRYGIV